MSGEAEAVAVQVLQVEDNGISVTQGIGCAKQDFAWRIENFDVVCRNKELLTAQELRVVLGEPAGVPCEWRFQLVNTKKNWLGFDLTLMNAPERDFEVCISLHFRIKKKNQEENFMRGGSDVPIFIKVESGIICDMVLEIGDDLDVEKLPLTADKALVLFLTVRTFEPLERRCRNLKGADRFKDNYFRQFTKDLSFILKQGRNPDIKIISKDGQEFKAHVMVLWAKNSFLKEKIALEDRRNGCDSIKLDYSGKALGLLLEYIYGVPQKDREAQWFHPDCIVDFVKGVGQFHLMELYPYMDQVLGEKGKGEYAEALLFHVEQMGLEKAVKKLKMFIKSGAVTCSIPEDTELMELE